MPIAKPVRIALALLASTAGTSAFALPLPADTILTKARIYTVDARRPWAQAVAIKAGRIEAVGSDAEIARLKGPATQVVDLHGRLLLPSFGDVHVHPMFGGLSHTGCSLQDGNTVDDYKRIVAACVAKSPGNGTIYGSGWKDGYFPPNGVPDKAILDAIAPDRPIILKSTGGHTVWVNSKALANAGITKDTRDPRNGKVDRDANGEPVGCLEEEAQGLVDAQVPPTTEKDREDALYFTLHTLNALGITNWQDALVEVAPDGSSPVVDAYRAVQQRGNFTTNATLDLLWANGRGLEQLPTLFATATRADAEGVRVNGIKFLLDGVIPQHTAAMLQPYEGGTDRGDLQVSEAVFKEAVKQVDAHGLQAHVHAIGDRAVHVALDGFEGARAAGFTRSRDMISHMNVIESLDQPRFGKLGVTAIFQPLWASDEPYMRLSIKAIGPVRSRYIYPEQGVLTGGGRIAYGSDWPVASADPLWGIEVALTRTDPEHPELKPLLPGEAVTLAEAVKDYTLEPAWVNRLEHETGSIEVGKSADMVILDKDIFRLAPKQIHTAKVLTTIFKGKPVYGSLD
ncbi:amidohydrolase [Sphingomonas oryzagri]|uniref:Amidohydrolase n=1 Tax=Sphingomonas oryzagri TaxID=3042314 RepID=A0ABT6MXD9_9SPHN|nr:amidohydrolase [Sphingomonas oryzagri]MDH7637710.1 amidohydrolase [Sphingomonas oryzagri]